MLTKRQIKKSQEARREKQKLEENQRIAMENMEVKEKQIKDLIANLLDRASDCSMNNQTAMYNKLALQIAASNKKLHGLQSFKMDVEMKILDVQIHGLFLDAYTSTAELARTPGVTINGRKMKKMRKDIEKMMDEIEINDQYVSEMFGESADYSRMGVSQSELDEVNSLVAARVAEKGGSLAGAPISNNLGAEIDKEIKQNIY